MQDTTFHRAIIEGRAFSAQISERGPIVLDEKGHWAAVGITSITPVKVETDFHEIATEWWVINYNGGGRIWLKDMSREGRVRLAIEFGIPMSGDDQGYRDYGERFKKSPAFDGLVRWAQANPRQFRARASRDQYETLWQEAVLRVLLPEAA